MCLVALPVHGTTQTSETLARKKEQHKKCCKHLPVSFPASKDLTVSGHPWALLS